MSALPGPTGEDNDYRLLPRERVLGVALNPQDLLIQLAAVTSVGGKMLWPDTSVNIALYEKLPADVKAVIDITPVSTLYEQPFDAVIHHGNAVSLHNVCTQLAARHGPIVSVQGLSSGDSAIRLERLLIERAICTNSAAAGGNTRLMTL
ncbi:hypothetical protein AU509_12775 [Lonsdalea britannica]|nr:hypothetical protein AU509_12775 [Lonsdalea britannica]